jgi:Conserved TM helix
MDIGVSVQNVLNQIVGFLPNLLAFLVLLLVGYIVAKLVAVAVRKLLEKADVDRRVRESNAHRYLSTLAGASPARTTARVVFWLIFACFLFAAIGALNVPALTAFMNQVVAYLPNILAAILIFVVAAVLAGVVAAGVNRMMGDTPTGKIAGTVLPALIMVVAGFMILQQLRIAEEIVQIAFAATMGALALGLALAFGLGGRPVAQQMLQDAYRKGQEQRNQKRAEAGGTRAGENVPRPRTPSAEGVPATESHATGARGDQPPPPRSP